LDGLGSVLLTFFDATTLSMTTFSTMTLSIMLLSIISLPEWNTVQVLHSRGGYWSYPWTLH
jgi:hypothetical protein